MKKHLTTLFSLLMTLCILFTASPASANEYTFFQAVMCGDFPPVDSHLLLLDDYLSINLPSYWHSVKNGDVLYCTGAGEEGLRELLITWKDETELPYQDIQSMCEEMSYVSCHMKTTGFEWRAFEIPQGVTVLYQAENAKTYVLLLLYNGDRPAPDSATASDFHAIVSSLAPADDLTRTLWKVQQGGNTSAEEAVQFEDATFEAMFLEAAGLDPNTSVPASLLQQVTSLFIRGDRMSLRSPGDLPISSNELETPLSLADLKLFPNLMRLYVCDMRIAEADALQSCSQLESLTLIGCGLTSCDFLSPLVQLQTLNLARNDIVSLDPIAGMTCLSELNLFCNPVQNLQPLAEMTSLQELILSGTQVRTLEPLSGCIMLEELTAQDIEGEALSLRPLSGLKNLSAVHFEGTAVYDREGIAHVENVKLGSWSAL